MRGLNLYFMVPIAAKRGGRRGSRGGFSSNRKGKRESQTKGKKEITEGITLNKANSAPASSELVRRSSKWIEPGRGEKNFHTECIAGFA